MAKIVINPTTLAEPVGHFDRGVKIGDYLHISGTSALTNVSGAMADRKLAPTIEEQTRLTFENIKKVCEAAGCSLDDVFEIRFFIKRREDFGVVDAMAREYLPKRGFIAHGYQGELLHPDMLIEIEAKAYVPSP